MNKEKQSSDTENKTGPDATPAPAKQKPTAEKGGPPGPEPTRYGDWERGGKCVDF